MLIRPLQEIKPGDFDFMPSVAVKEFANAFGFGLSTGADQRNWATLPIIYHVALSREISMHYHYITYKQGEQFPLVYQMIENSFYEALPKIQLAWTKYDPDFFGVTFADMWDYTAKDIVEHGKKILTTNDITNKTDFGRTIGSTSSSEGKSMGEDSPITASIGDIVTPSSKSVSNSSGSANSSEGGSETKTRTGTVDKENSGKDITTKEEGRTYKNARLAKEFYTYFVDGKQDVISIIRDCCRFMVYEYNFPLI